MSQVIPDLPLALVIEPDTTVVEPYHLVAQHYRITRVSDLEAGRLVLQDHQPAVIVISTLFPAEALVEFLEYLNKQQSAGLIPLIWSLQFNASLIEFPGTSWGGLVGVIHSMSSASEVAALVERLQQK